MSPIITPDAPYSFITEHLAIGGLRAYAEPLLRFYFVLNVAEELEKQTKGAPPRHPDGGLSMHCGFDDTLHISSEIPKILRAVSLVQMYRQHASHHPLTKSVLVTCAQGRNRSGVVIAETLIQEGADPDYVIRTMQERRKGALTNTAFVAWLKRKRR